MQQSIHRDHKVSTARARMQLHPAAALHVLPCREIYLHVTHGAIMRRENGWSRCWTLNNLHYILVPIAHFNWPPGGLRVQGRGTSNRIKKSDHIK